MRTRRVNEPVPLRESSSRMALEPARPHPVAEWRDLPGWRPTDVRPAVAPRARAHSLPLWAARCAGKRIDPALCGFAKRVVDVAGSLVLIVLAAPLMLGIAIAIKMASPGPFSFRQVRVGLNGRRFTMLKFRTMVVNAEKLKAGLAGLNEAGKILFKIRNDPRVTGIGRILRRTSLDELPQLWNVLRGRMSLVGPRPPVPEEVAKYTPEMRKRLSVKPGITGLWQVSGRSTIPHLRGFALDVWYARKWCLLLDIVILVRTISAVLSRRGAL